MNATASERCAHAGCRCSVPVGDTYCSEHCRQAGNKADAGPCDCGHTPCEPAQRDSSPVDAP